MVLALAKGWHLNKTGIGVPRGFEFLRKDAEGDLAILDMRSGIGNHDAQVVFRSEQVVERRTNRLCR